MEGSRETIQQFCSALKQTNEGSVSVILIGSVARDATTPKSDIDLLLIGTTESKLPSVPANFHVHAMKNEEFRSKLREGDDLAAWSVRYGIPIQDDGKWAAIVDSPEAKTWPRWQKKMLHATRRLVLARTLLETGDVDSASEESLYAASHVVRALLLRSQIFPLSRAELIKQAQTAGHERLAGMLTTLLFGEPDARFVKRTIQYLKKLLIHMDKSEYQRRSAELALRSSSMKKRNRRI
jgi:predicted nucleotidyltransferase